MKRLLKTAINKMIAIVISLVLFFFLAFFTAIAIQVFGALLGVAN